MDFVIFYKIAGAVARFNVTVHSMLLSEKIAFEKEILRPQLFFHRGAEAMI